ncbi:hypothetical protein PLICRDRAFT_702635 [Plicaturopsis crispa FD-325 SS-3]|uniref:Unplaced genomic scaffold PLICRscaffold_32, whole genome shotgun sequence n=1 Tax=Plicaturopsis crispa FD-325 SS-3 TaxID=944288 RepID=A0A0C9T1L2_PLICR|nr:hypothetical protein PLICRDRAFT_702635 [Plicaturopsis crispa FD-325 SS-3]
MPTPMDSLQLLNNLSRNILRARPGEVTPETLSPIFPHLDSARIPTRVRPSSADRVQVQLGICALLVVTACDIHLHDDPVLVARILEPDGWPCIWKWIHFLHDKFIVGDAYGATAYASAVNAIGRTLQALGRATASRAVVTGTPGVITLVTKRWLHDGGHGREGGSPYMPPGENGRTFANALTSLLNSEGGGRPDSVMPQVLDAANGDTKLIATTALGQLREALAMESTYLILLHLSLVNCLSDTTHPHLHIALLDEGTIPTVIQVLSWCNARPLHKASASLMLLCHSNIIVAFNSINGPLWVVQALNSGFLPALLRSGNFLHRVDHPFIVSLLTSMLSELLLQHLIFRSILRAVRRALKQVEKQNVGTAAASGVLWDVWTQFKARAEERLCLLDAWDTAGGRHKHRICNQVNCQQEDDQMTKLCSGCFGPMYCSKACQRLDWPVHRERCKASRKLLQDGLRARLDDGDLSFIRFIVDGEIRRRLPGVVKDARTKGVSLNMLVLEFDFSAVPMDFRVKDIFDYEVDPIPDHDGDLQDILRRAVDSGGESMAARTLIPQGEMSASLVSLIDIELFLDASATT